MTHRLLILRRDGSITEETVSGGDIAGIRAAELTQHPTDVDAVRIYHGKTLILIALVLRWEGQELTGEWNE